MCVLSMGGARVARAHEGDEASRVMSAGGASDECVMPYAHAPSPTSEQHAAAGQVPWQVAGSVEALAGRRQHTECCAADLLSPSGRCTPSGGEGRRRENLLAKQVPTDDVVRVVATDVVLCSCSGCLRHRRGCMRDDASPHAPNQATNGPVDPPWWTRGPVDGRLWTRSSR